MNAYGWMVFVLFSFLEIRDQISCVFIYKYFKHFYILENIPIQMEKKNAG